MSRFINLNKFLLALLVLALVPFFSLQSQEKGFSYDLSVDLVSMYNFRGIDYGSSPAIQPNFEASYGGLSFFIWGSQAIMAAYDFNGEKHAFNEIDWGMKYELNTPIGTFTPGFTLYYCPFEGQKFFNLKGVEDGVAKGSQTMNVQFRYTHSKEVPIHLIVDYNFFNNPENPIYLGLSYDVFNTPKYRLEPFVGFAKGTGPGGKTAMYSVTENELTFVNVGFNFTKRLEVSDKLTLPLTSTFTIQPHTERVNFAFKLSI